MNTLKVWGRIPSQHLGFLLLAGAVSTLAPSLVHNQRVLSFSKPLTIHTPKAEPPRVAFDLLISENRAPSSDDFAILSKTPSISLVAGRHQFIGKNPLESLRSQKIVLQPMVFTHDQVQKTVEDRKWIAELSPDQQKRVIEADQRYGTLDRDWTVKRFDQLVEDKMRELPAEKKNDSNPGKILIEAQDAQGQTHGVDSIHTASVQVKSASEITGRSLMAGNIRYKDPLPSGPQWTVAVNHFIDGIDRGDGRYLNDGKFEIPISEKTGVLVARVQDKDTGQVIGEGTLRLSELTAKNPTIEIRKSVSQVAVNFSSFYSHTQRLISEPTAKDRGVPAQVYFASLDHQVQTDQLGSAQVDQVLKGSWSLVRAESENYYPGIFLVRSGEERRLPLFPNKMVQALKKIIQDQSRFSQFDENGSIVWGQVVRGGQPISGAHVSVESDSEYQPIYFNSLLIPDPTLKATSDNGYFVVLNLEPGFHSLLASQAGVYLSHSNVVTDENAISVADMTSSMDRDSVSLRVFDAFNGTAQKAQVEMQSLPEALSVDGYANVNLSLKHQLSFARVHPESTKYLDTLVLYDDGSDHVHAPLIQMAWLNQIQQQRKINPYPDTGIVIGFVPSVDFETYLPNDSHYSPDQIVYFDANGSITDHGVAGGGFILFNVKPGVQSVVIGDKNSEMLQTQVLPVDAQSVVTLKFR